MSFMYPTKDMQCAAVVTECRYLGVVDALGAVVSLVVQRADLPGGDVSWTVLDAEYSVLRPVDRFLAHLRAVDRPPQTVRSCAFGLRDLFAFLLQFELAFDEIRALRAGQYQVARGVYNHSSTH